MTCRDSNGAELADGDNVTLIKDLKVKGTSVTLKRGTLIRNIRLTGDDAEIQADIGEGAADRTPAHLPIQFLVRWQMERARIVVVQQRRFFAGCAPGCGGFCPWRGRRRAVVRLQVGVRRPDEAEVAAPGGAGEQITLQGEGAENAAAHAEQDDCHVVGAEDGGCGGELGFRGEGGGVFGEVAAVGDEGADDAEDAADASEDAAGCFRLVGAGRIGSGVWSGGCRLHGWIYVLGPKSASIGISWSGPAGR